MAGTQVLTGTQVPLDAAYIADLGADNLRDLYNMLGYVDPALLGITDTSGLPTNKAGMLQTLAGLNADREYNLAVRESNARAAAAARSYEVQAESARKAYALDAKRLGIEEANAKFNQEMQRAQLAFQKEVFGAEYELDKLRFGNEVAEQNFNQRMGEAQVKLAGLELLASRSGPQDWVAYNNILNGLSAPGGEAADPYGLTAGLVQPVNPNLPAGNIPTYGTQASSTGTAATGTTGSTARSGGFGPNRRAESGERNERGEGSGLTGGGTAPAAGTPAGSAPVSTGTGYYAGIPDSNIVLGTATAGLDVDTTSLLPRTPPRKGQPYYVAGQPKQVNVPRNTGPSPEELALYREQLANERARVEAKRAAAATPAGNQDINLLPPGAQSTNPQADAQAAARAQARALEEARAAAMRRQAPYTTSVPGAAYANQGGVFPGGTAVVTGDSPGGKRTGYEELVMSFGPMQVIPLNGREMPRDVPRAASGGVYGMPATPTYTTYSPETLGSQPFIQKLRGEMPANQFGEFGASLSNPSLGIYDMPSNINLQRYMSLLPSEQDQTQSLYQQGLGVDFRDMLEQARRASPWGASFGPASYGGR